MLWKRLLSLADAVPAQSVSAERAAELGASSGSPSSAGQSDSHCEQTRSVHKAAETQEKHQAFEYVRAACRPFLWLVRTAVLAV